MATRREQLAEAATDYAIEHGLIGLSLRPLAVALGTSDRMLLYHFRDKDGLYAAVLRSALDLDELPDRVGIARGQVEGNRPDQPIPTRGVEQADLGVGESRKSLRVAGVGLETPVGIMRGQIQG